MKKNSSRIAFVVILVSLFMVSAGCSTAPDAHSQKDTEQSSASPSWLDQVRWWDQGMQEPVRELVEESPDQIAARVPTRSDPKIVVLMYHNIVFGRTGGEYNRDLYNFEHDLVFLRNRTQIIGIDELPDIQAGRKKLDTDASIITFDDGDLSIYAIVFPLLKKYDIKAAFFVITDFVGTVGYVSWDQLREMSDYRNARGEQLFTIGSHSLDHRRFDELSADQIARELSESKTAIETRIGARVRFFALPFGAGADRREIVDTAKKAGYRGIRTSTPVVIKPESIDLFNIPAVYVNNESADSLRQRIYVNLLGR